MSSDRIAVIVGSLRAGSINRKLARALVGLAPKELELQFVEIGELPLYNADLEANVPKPWADFRQQVGACAGVLFVSPEYNRSVPGVLKNAIDVGSRPYGKSVWSGKPAAVITASPGAVGGFGANQHLRQSFVFLDMPAMQQPEAYISGADKLFDAQGAITNPSTVDFLRGFMQRYAQWVQTHLKS
ncbi:MAG TPA: NAD(P)H-dependent oxidoreductase [Burkholderiaceae bacterium]|jgi:chromate reductase|nr:NAD(P)H-dependent oxidoreductase [Burkholderiaceae bacterium]